MFSIFDSQVLSFFSYTWACKGALAPFPLGRPTYRAFHRFGQAKFPDGGSVLGLSQFSVLPQLPPRIMLSLKEVNIDAKISNSLSWASADFFPGEGKIFQGGQKHTICPKNILFSSKKVKKNKIFWPARGVKGPLLPSPADAHARFVNLNP